MTISSLQRLLFPLPLLLRGSDGLADGAATLPGVQSALEGLGGLLDNFGGLGEDELNVGGVAHVRVDLDMLEETATVDASVRTRP